LIIKEGDRSNALFIVASGTVEVLKDRNGKNERRLAIMGPCSYLGEMALIDNEPRWASVVAKEDAHLLSLERMDLHREIERMPAMAIELLRMLTQRIRLNECYIANTLGVFLPICASCKKIREEDGVWTDIEKYISENSKTQFSHGLCPECVKKLYPELYKDEWDGKIA
jgi:CRP-like cAMP-binding protein